MESPFIGIDLESTIPVRRQILEQLRAALVEGTLKPGDELPSVRRLGIDLGIHFNTVAEVYRMLAEEGWIEVSQGRSARVIRREKPPAADPDSVQRFRQRLRYLIAEMRMKGLSPARIARELASAAEGMK